MSGPSYILKELPFFLLVGGNQIFLGVVKGGPVFSGLKGGPKFPIGKGGPKIFPVCKGGDQKKLATGHHRQTPPLSVDMMK